MLPRKGGCRPQQAGLRVTDDLNGYARHQLLVAALVAESSGKAGGGQSFADTIAEPAGDHDSAKPSLRERNITGDAAQCHAEAIDSGTGETVLTARSEGPDLDIAELRDRAILERGKRAINIDNAGPRDDPFDRNPRVKPAQAREDRVVNCVDRGVVNVSAFGGLDPERTVFAAPEMRDTKPGARADYADRAGGRERLVGTGKVDEVLVERFLALPYFAVKPPKSLDRNDFEAVLADLPEDGADAMATLAVMSAASVAKAREHFPVEPQRWYVCGGGRKNAHMIDLLSQKLAPAKVEAIESVGYDGDAIEAQAFAYLAVRSLLGLPISLPCTTGVAQPLAGGVLHKA